MAERYISAYMTDLEGSGAFHAVLRAMASNDPERIALAENDARTALSGVVSTLHVVAGYLDLRALHPSENLYASDHDVAKAVYSLSDIAACLNTTLNEANIARIHLKETARKVPANRSKGG